jgi:murein DD-endopeptidase MepM/ murein hydrolase activator NlpD
LPSAFGPTVAVDPVRPQDPDPRRPIGHPSHRNEVIVPIRPPVWDWSFEQDGALALDRHDLWPEPAKRPEVELSQSPPPEVRLKAEAGPATVRPMAPRPSRQARIERQRRARARRRVGRLAGAIVLGVVLLVTLLLTAFGSSNPRTVEAAVPAPAQRLLPTGPPSPQVIALQGSLRIQLPIPQERLTAIGVSPTTDGALPLSPLGTKGNQGFLARSFHRIFGGGGGHGPKYYELGGKGSANTTLDIGAAAGTDVYAPVDGTVVGLTPFVINGRTVGAQIDIQPLADPAAVVSVTQIRPDQSLSVGDSLAAATSRIGTVAELSKIEEQALARFTQDAGNHVTIAVYPAATLSIP